MSIKWETICIFNTKDALCLVGFPSSQEPSTLLSPSEVVWARRGCRGHLIVWASIVPFVYLSRAQSHFQNVQVDRLHMRVLLSPFSWELSHRSTFFLSQNSLWGTSLKNGCCPDEWAFLLLLYVRARVKEGACHC